MTPKGVEIQRLRTGTIYQKKCMDSRKIKPQTEKFELLKDAGISQSWERIDDHSVIRLTKECLSLPYAY